jgi:hypothetical protein
VGTNGILECTFLSENAHRTDRSPADARLYRTDRHLPAQRRIHLLCLMMVCSGASATMSRLETFGGRRAWGWGGRGRFKVIAVGVELLMRHQTKRARTHANTHKRTLNAQTALYPPTVEAFPVNQVRLGVSESTPAEVGHFLPAPPKGPDPYHQNKRRLEAPIASMAWFSHVCVCVCVCCASGGLEVQMPIVHHLKLPLFHHTTNGRCWQERRDDPSVDMPVAAIQ